MRGPNQLAVNAFQFNFWYGNFQALKDITLSVESKKMTALIGPSGCGKSTFLKCLNRITELTSDPRYSGSIEIYDEDIYHPSVALPELRRQVGMVFQKPNPLPLSVRDNILFGINAHSEIPLKKDEKDHHVESALKKVGLWDKLKDKQSSSALTLTLEKQQKLCLARLLPLKPMLILLDEPCSALDPHGTQEIEDLIAELKHEYSLIMVTHSMAQAKRVSDKTVFMYMGEIVEVGETKSLFTQPKQKKTADYIEGRFG